jgi:hypothetical protein
MSDVLLYQAANTIEGQMIVDVLAQTGIEARIQGAYLQGGIGELQALGVVRVMVAEQDYARAREVTDQWDQTPVPASADPERLHSEGHYCQSEREAGTNRAGQVRSSRVLWGVLIGAVMAVAWLIFIAKT